MYACTPLAPYTVYCDMKSCLLLIVDNMDLLSTGLKYHQTMAHSLLIETVMTLVHYLKDNFILRHRMVDPYVHTYCLQFYLANLIYFLGIGPQIHKILLIP